MPKTTKRTSWNRVVTNGGNCDGVAAPAFSLSGFNTSTVKADATYIELVMYGEVVYCYDKLTRSLRQDVKMETKTM